MLPKSRPILIILAVLMSANLFCDIGDRDDTAADILATSSAIVATRDAEATAGAIETNAWNTQVAALETERAGANGTATGVALTQGAERTADAIATLDEIVKTHVAETETAEARPTATQTPTPAPLFLTLLTIQDPLGDGIDCLSAEALGAQTAPEVDFGRAILSGNTSTVTLQLNFPGVDDLSAAIGNSLFQAGIGIHNPGFDLPPVDPGIAFSGLINEQIIATRAVTGVPFTPAQMLYRNGAFGAPTYPKDIEIVVSVNQLEFNIPNSYLPETGYLIVFAGLSGRQCDELNAAEEPGSVIEFERSATGLGFKVRPRP